jgi:lysophospholipid acyltransferase (LPLAT)-like uncharacterized protein
MKLRHPGLIAIFALLASWLIRIWVGTLRFRVACLDGTKLPEEARARYVFPFWHEAMLLATFFRTRVTILISQHADGEFIARVCKHLGYEVVRGSTTRGTIPALNAMIQKASGSHLVITPDGPRGPRRKLQLGTVLLASWTGLSVVPVAFAASAGWRAPSWDRMLLPRPWGTAYVIFGVPLHVPDTLHRPELERFRVLVEHEMTRLTAAAERWARDGIRPMPAKRTEETARRAA